MKSLIELMLIEDSSELSKTDLLRLYLDDSLSEEQLYDAYCTDEDNSELYTVIALNWWLNNRDALQGRFTYDAIIVRLCTQRPETQSQFDDILETYLSGHFDN